MQVTVTIHEAWLVRPEDLRRVMALLAGLEIPPPGSASASEPQGYDLREYPEPDFPRDRGGAWEPPADEPDQDGDDDDPNTPEDGRQLLGWASKQVPDAKGTIISFGKKNGLASKVIEWTPEQVAAAYRFARGQGAAPAGPAPRKDDGPYKPRYSNGELNRRARRFSS
jgi:hypothetical protein